MQTRYNFKRFESVGIIMGGAIGFIKCLMFFFNFLIFLGGLCLLGTGAWITANPDGFKYLVSSHPLIYTGATIILVVGLILFLVGFLGCWGAISESKCLIMTFFILILLIFLVELIGAVLVFVFKKQIKTENFLTELKSKYKGENSKDVFSKTWDTIMIAFSCCGVTGPDDFMNVTALRKLPPSKRVPLTCCKRSDTGKILNKKECLLGNPNFRNDQGCYRVLVGHFMKYIHIIGICTLSVLLVEFFAMGFAICLYWKF
uniref:Tetraspanin n=1 Tax=Callorhinchus milii TaxID=7868 RepID=A0A4W3JPW5_CALMI|eukprot:gi/632953240/ref/XP_007892309.1/ PREDICTED: tetraspanin-18-like [Callorhinchus milii]